MLGSGVRSLPVLVERLSNCVVEEAVGADVEARVGTRDLQHAKDEWGRPVKDDGLFDPTDAVVRGNEQPHAARSHERQIAKIHDQLARRRQRGVENGLELGSGCAVELTSDGDDDGFRNRYLSASASLGLREDDELGLNLFHSDGRNWIDVDLPFNSRIDKGIDSAGAYLRNKLASGWTSTLRLGYSEDRSHIRSTDAPVDKFDTEQSQFAWQHDVALAGGSLLAAYEYLE